MTKYQRFDRHALDDEYSLFSTSIPHHLDFDGESYKELWESHPAEYHEIMMHGRPVKTPRWQKAYGKDYHFTGQTYKAEPIPENLIPIVEWAQKDIFDSLNGVLLNWYDGAKKHYIGAHRDSTANMIDDAPIVTISLGQERVFRMRPWKGKGFHDFPAPHGKVFIMPFNTNQAWTHEVPHFAKYSSPQTNDQPLLEGVPSILQQTTRISITLRAFKK